MSPLCMAPSHRVAHIALGRVWHTRLRPRRHRFSVATFFLMLPMRTLREQPKAAGALALNRAGALAFWDADHGKGQGPNDGGDALQWLEALLVSEGVRDADGEIWLQCYPRMWGYAFKPVSFWYCHRADGSLRAIVVEVNNTFGERHVYLLDPPHDGQPLQARKVFHVSPFCAVEGHYQFEFRCSVADGQPSVQVRIDYHDAQGLLLHTGLVGQLVPLTAATRRRVLWRYPAMTLGVMARILWNAGQLWFKGVPVHAKPATPMQPVSRSSCSTEPRA